MACIFRGGLLLSGLVVPGSPLYVEAGVEANIAIPLELDDSELKGEAASSEVPIGKKQGAKGDLKTLCKKISFAISP